MVLLPIGSRCALLLPKKFLNPQRTPAKGLVTNVLLDQSSLVLIEEVWQLDSKVVVPNQTLQSEKVNWGWQPLPSLIAEGRYIALRAEPDKLMIPTEEVLDTLIKESIKDFMNLPFRS